ncbi:hypothetical protein [Bdellovibrio reynosensis]|uniref:Uncharacterized protein n=1 Tax=Bdellovibrio reynosensis TaxID=2835041 RepID=A0ABY4CA83_9BACT|nr:hypothetical protein [Bdellovibrio reynosensis]UOF01835.1 hypothetical protein MNR06_02565 [Bdellovibrio reynosensis]
MKITSILFLCLGMISFSKAHANDSYSNGYGWSLNYDWLNQIVNRTPVAAGHCPTLGVDVYGGGYKVSVQTSFYGSVSGSISKWFPKEEIWSSLAIGPMVNKFGIISSTVNKRAEIAKIEARKLPLTAARLAEWAVKDSAYWESQGGVSFYLGSGIDPVHVGAFGVVSGGWANYLEKTGANAVYVERSKKYIKSISLGAGIFYASAAIEAAYESGNGFNYEFKLDTPENQEAFERFMAGDTTLAYQLSKTPNSGVTKYADTSMYKFSKSAGLSISTPYIPVISLKTSTGKDYNHEEEISVWDESIVKDYGVYTKKSSSRLLGLHANKATSFKGGITKTEIGATNQVENKLYGQFKFAYQSDWGQEGRLGSQVEHALRISGLANEPETCVYVPKLKKTLGYNQVILAVNYDDKFMREILGMGATGSYLLRDIETRAHALNNQLGCDGVCSSVDGAFDTIRKNVRLMRDSMGVNGSDFSRGMANFGKAVWSNPNVFRAFFERGKRCGVELSFEVSGQRLTRFHKAKKYNYNDSCVLN